MPNLFDRVLTAVAPAWALDRAKTRLQAQVLMGFDGANGLQASAHDGPASGQGRNLGTRGWSPRARDARADTLRQLPTQRGQSRELARTSPIAVGAINTNVDRVVGTGLALSAQPNRDILGWAVEQLEVWKRKTQAEFALFTEGVECDICNAQSFYELQALVLRATLESGDCATVLPDAQPTRTNPYRLRIQVIEADRVGNPLGAMDTATVAGGVQMDVNGAALAYYIYDQHPGAAIFSGNESLYKGEWIQAIGPSGRRRVLHHFRKLRPGMPRGVPYLAPIVGIIKQLARYTEAEIAAAVISAYFTVFIESPDGNAAPVFSGSEGADTAGDDIQLGQGAVVGLAKGEKATFADPSRPNVNFDPFTIAMLRQVGMALSIPHELLMKQFNSSYSASKAALLDAWIYFRGVRAWLANSFCQPIYETWLAEAVASGRVSAPGFFADPLMRWAYTRAQWHGDSMGSINPKDEVAAYTAAIDARLMTRERAEFELFGSDFNQTFDAKKAEQDKLRDADLLPVPKAGAAAPQPSNETPAP
jgi:lambda family phage portal protein